MQAPRNGSHARGSEAEVYTDWSQGTHQKVKMVMSLSIPYQCRLAEAGRLRKGLLSRLVTLGQLPAQISTAAMLATAIMTAATTAAGDSRAALLGAGAGVGAEAEAGLEPGLLLDAAGAVVGHAAYVQDTWSCSQRSKRGSTQSYVRSASCPAQSVSTTACPTSVILIPCHLMNPGFRSATVAMIDQ